METLNIPLSKIETNRGQIPGLPSNPRTIKDSKFKLLMKSIEENPEMLQLRELLVVPYEDKYIIIGGNMRFKALRALKYKEAPCKVIPDDTDVEKLKAYTIKDNGDFGEWDFDMLANEWDVSQLGEWGVDVPEMEEEVDLNEEAEEDNYEEPDNIPARVKEGEVWILGEHRLICGDSTNPDTFDKLMEGKQADLVVTDTTYNVNYHGQNGMKIDNDNMASSAFLAFLTDAFKCLKDNTKPGGAIYIWHADLESLNFRQALRNNGMQEKQVLIWNKNALALGRQDYQWKHEPCLYLWKEGASHYFIDRRDLTTVQEDTESINIDKMDKKELKEFVRQILSKNIPTTIIDEEKPHNNDLHPTMKPLKLIGRQIRNSSRKNELVLDLFGGSGSTMMAAEQLGRRCFMVEFSPHYCDCILDRWEKMTGKTARKEE